MTTLFRDRRSAAEYTPPAVPPGPLAATVLADAQFRTATGRPLPPELRARPLPTIRAATAREGLESIIRGPSAVSFR